MLAKFSNILIKFSSIIILFYFPFLLLLILFYFLFLIKKFSVFLAGSQSLKRKILTIEAKELIKIDESKLKIKAKSDLEVIKN